MRSNKKAEISDSPPADTLEPKLTILDENKKFNPNKYIHNFSKLPKKIQKHKLRELGFDIEGNPIEDSGIITLDTLITVEGISDSITLEKAIELKEALEAAIESVGEIK